MGCPGQNIYLAAKIEMNDLKVGSPSSYLVPAISITVLRANVVSCDLGGWHRLSPYRTHAVLSHRMPLEYGMPSITMPHVGHGNYFAQLEARIFIR